MTVPEQDGGGCLANMRTDPTRAAASHGVCIYRTAVYKAQTRNRPGFAAAGLRHAATPDRASILAGAENGKKSASRWQRTPALRGPEGRCTMTRGDG
jgi:hypothetical protein